MNLFAPSQRAGRIAAVIATVGFAGIALFELALALGAPLGHAAYGGSTAQLSAGERVVSVVAVIVWLTAAVVVLGRSGFLAVHRPTELLRRTTWVLVGVSAVAALPNLVSQSPWEQLVFGPTALVLAVLCLVVARSSAGPRSAVLARRAS
jgi:hypothetical protein